VTVLIQYNNTLQYNKSTCHVFILQAFSRTHLLLLHAFTSRTRTLPVYFLFPVSLLLLHAFTSRTRTLPVYFLFPVSFAYVIEILSTLIFGPGSNPGGGEIFPHRSRPALKPTQTPIQRVPGLFPGVKRPGRGVDHPLHLAPRLKKEYNYTISLP